MLFFIAYTHPAKLNEVLLTLLPRFAQTREVSGNLFILLLLAFDYRFAIFFVLLLLFYLVFLLSHLYVWCLLCIVQLQSSTKRVLYNTILASYWLALTYIAHVEYTFIKMHAINGVNRMLLALKVVSKEKKEFILYLCTCAKEWKYIKSIWIVVVFDNNQLNVIELCASLHLVYNFIFIYIFCECRVCRCMRLMLASEFLCHLQNI